MTIVVVCTCQSSHQLLSVCDRNFCFHTFSRHVNLLREQIEHGNVSERSRGLQNLRYILRHNQNSSSVGDIAEVSFHAIYEILFKIVLSELSLWLKATTKTTRSALENRLSSCAQALRQAVEAGVPTLQTKTLRALVDHVIHTMLLSSGELCGPLALDYTKLFRSLLSHQPHVEHFTKTEWKRTVEFCTAVLKLSNDEIVDGDVSSSVELKSHRGLSFRSSRSTRSLIESSTSHDIRHLTKQVAEEMVCCLSFLTAAPNASITTQQAPSLLWALVEFLDTASLAGRCNQDAFTAINHILAWTRIEDTVLTQKATKVIISLSRYFWAHKSLALKDELLIALLYLKPYILRLSDQNQDPSFRADLAGLLGVMRAEYSCRQERKQLRIDDLLFNRPWKDSASVCATTLALKSNCKRAEHSWALVHILSFLTSVLISSASASGSSANEEGEEAEVRPYKRQKVTDDFAGLLTSTANDTNASRACALQTLLFFMQRHHLSVSQLAEAIDVASAVYGDDSGSLSAWSFLILDACAAQSRSRAAALLSQWSSVWQLGVRGMTNTATCRTACRLLDTMLQLRLVGQPGIADLTQAITFSIDVNGPSVLADTVANFLGRIISLSQQSNPGTASIIAESVLAWVLRSFIPSRFEDKTYAVNHCLIGLSEVVQIIDTCLGHQPHGCANSHFHVWDRIGQVWLACNAQHELISYLLLAPQKQQIFHETLDEDKEISSSMSSVTHPRQSCQRQLLNFFILDLRRTQERWDLLRQDRASSISLDMFMSLSSACTSLVCITSCHVFEDKRRQHQLQVQVQTLLESICSYASETDCSQDKYDSLLLCFAQTFTGFRVRQKHEAHLSTRCERVICRAASTALPLHHRAQYKDDHDLDENEIDVDMDSDSQDSHHANTTGSVRRWRNDASVLYSKRTLRSSTILYARLVCHMVGHDLSSSDTIRASTLVVDDIVTMSGFEVLNCRAVLMLLPHYGLLSEPAETERLMEFFTEVILSAYEYERCEVATGVILDVMLTLIAVWTNSSNTSLFGLGLDMYDWFTKTALTAAVLSSAVQKKVVELLIALCNIDTDYGKDSEVPSVLMGLYKLLQLGTVTVLYHLAGRITTIFHRYILSSHSDIFNELQTYLPTDADWIEGLAMRLLFLSNLAATWPSLLRSCVYYMFETAAIIEGSTLHAAECIHHLTLILKFDTPQKLFSLFAPQLLHTFLENKKLKSLPFAAFRYHTLEELLQSNQIEITAQLLMRGSEDELQFLVASLSTSTAALVETAFAKSFAYATAWDIAQPQVDGKSPAEADARVRKYIMSRDKWKQLLVDLFPTIMGQFYLSVSELDDMHDTWLEKKPRYQAASQALIECKKHGHSTKELAPSQQPSFKSKRLCDQIERLCRRTEKIPGVTPVDPIRPWDTSSFSLAVRMLLDSVHTALGSLHASTVVRKLRLLISMAGPVALSGFPLEMLIYSIRPFLDDTECADDAIGILHYLFQHGQRHLVTDALKFTNGVAMLIILQMRHYSMVSHGSTTHESQYQITIQMMRAFEDWLIKFLRHSQGSGNDVDNTFYLEMTGALASSQLPGSGSLGSEESKLLLLLLDQFERPVPILSHAHCHEALQILSKGFRVPTSTSNDCLGEDRLAIKYANTLWQVLQTASLDRGFKLWAARALGRSYASSGLRPSLLRKDGADRSSPSGIYPGSQQSQALIACRLSEMIMSRERAEASLADHTLRLISETFVDDREAMSFLQMLPPSLSLAVEKGVHGYIPREATNPDLRPISQSDLREALQVRPSVLDLDWMGTLAITLCQYGPKIPVLPALPTLLRVFPDVAAQLLPAIVHLALLQEKETEQVLKKELSNSITAHFSEVDSSMCIRQRFLLKLLLYLRGQPWPGESTQAKRLDGWLTVDYLLTAEAATRCGLATAALIMVESLVPTEKALSRRRARLSEPVPEVFEVDIPNELLLRIFRRVDEPDSFYGVQQSASLDSVLDRLDYERDGFKSLMFRSARMDGSMGTNHQSSVPGSIGIVHSLSALRLNSLTYSLLSSQVKNTAETASEMLEAARKLQQWDVSSPEAVPGPATTSFTMFQHLSRTTDLSQMQHSLSTLLLDHIETKTQSQPLEDPSLAWYATLATLAEASEVLDIRDNSNLVFEWERMSARSKWMQSAPFEDCQSLMSNRQTLFSVIAQNKDLSTAMHVSTRECRGIEARSLVTISTSARQHGVLQEALSASTQLSLLAGQAKSLGLRVEAAAKVETASVLWDMGETTVSVKMLQDVVKEDSIAQEDIVVGLPGLLARIGHQLAGARLVKPDDIKTDYLESAIEHLQGSHLGEEAGKVYFEFASFCDQQLQNPGNIEDLDRMTKIRQDRQVELNELSDLRRSKSDNEKKYVDRSYEKAASWFRVDDAEYQRLKSSRQASIQSSLQNYLLALKASDLHDICVLRFFALWLENASNPSANDVVRKYLLDVPCWKFILLLNQLMSRLEHVSSTFQSSLKHLLKCLCKEHPYHSLHHLYASTRKPASSDSGAFSRYQAASLIRQEIQKTEAESRLKNFFIAEGQYNLLAQTPNPPSKSSKVTLSDFPGIPSKLQIVQQLRVPPATINLPLKPDGDYSDIPVVTGFATQVMIMSGLSAPKVLTARASNGQDFKQLFKGGNDDLRQDAIMEQVFEEVSKMLRKNKLTRERGLQVRTYKVIPLTTRSGIIEFVPNSIPINDFLGPAHQKYWPSDMRADAARNKISTIAKNGSISDRVKIFRQVCDHLHPVMRHFFLERFIDPDEWFAKRTAYTRTTASVSMLGHVLGLGDRHCHNILLDEESGEVIHIDLGVAFEAGRVLPIPELVPFRMTRDIVDGMGITKTEGVFRRCCEFTMDALREDKDSIMTLLNVLRYDPLVNWTLSPVRAKRMQDAQETGRTNGNGIEPSSRKREQEAGEADRALAIVEKKLSTTLSTAATVNELIQAATDEKHLATLFHGWAAFY
nr:serine/threonine-protein kinase tel1 [Quercus suber]